jgi:DNA-binding response OmpR family regulator
VAACRETAFDLVIMDIMMPGLDGFMALKEIRRFSQVPVIMLSARGEEYDKLFGFELGVDDYIVKPFSPKELMARVNAILSRMPGGVQGQGYHTVRGTDGGCHRAQRTGGRCARLADAKGI